MGGQKSISLIYRYIFFSSICHLASFCGFSCTFKILTHFEFIFCIWCKSIVYFYSSACSYPVSQNHLLSFPYCVLLIPSLQINWPHMYTLFHLSVYLFSFSSRSSTVPYPHVLYYCLKSYAQDSYVLEDVLSLKNLSYLKVSASAL